MMKITILLSLQALLMLTPWSESRASVLSPDFSTKTAMVSENLHIADQKQKRPGLFQKFRAIKALKKLVQEQALEGKKASKMARIALWIFAASLIMGTFGNAVPALGYIGFFGLLASNVMAIMILTKKEKGNSRVIAISILVTTLILILLAALLIIFLFALFATIFG